MENPFNREKSEKPQGEQQRRDSSPRTDRRAIDVVTDKTVYSYHVDIPASVSVISLTGRACALHAVSMGSTPRLNCSSLVLFGDRFNF